MEPKRYLHALAQAVSKRSGIAIATLEVAIPALFDEIRQTLAEGRYRCVSVESFGTFTVKMVPSRHYTRRFPDGHTEVIELPEKLRVQFLPSRNLRNEVEASHFDPTRESFVCHPDDRPLKFRKSIPDPYKKRKRKPFSKDNMQMRGLVEKDAPSVPDIHKSRHPTILQGKPKE